MLRRLQRIHAVARLIVLDGLRRHAVLGLVALSVAAEAGGLLFFDFIPREIGRASSDFIFSISWITGLLFLFFHCVHAVAWNDEKRVIHCLLSRPVSRGEYAVGVFFGLAILLLLLNLVLGGLGWGTLLWIKGIVPEAYFSHLSPGFYLLTWLGLLSMELMILSVIILFSGLVRGGFPVLLMSTAFYSICSGLPVVRESMAQRAERLGETPALTTVLQGMTALFPDFDRLDFKNLVVSTDPLPGLPTLAANFGLVATYVIMLLWAACAVYRRRDLQ
jgi:ABC-type transport system involved in multi-copper enzyme maturation permease subunit